MAGRRCPECGLVVHSLGAHKGKKLCQAAKAAKAMEELGYVRATGGRLCVVDDYTKYVSFKAIPEELQRFVRKAPSAVSGHYILDEDWIPKWACALLLMGPLTDEIVEGAKANEDVQIALALEYDLRTEW